MAFQTLDITLGSAQKLNSVNLIKKMHVYAFVSVSGGGDGASDQVVKTLVDHDGDANPTWKEKFQFKLDEAALQANRLTLSFNLLCEHSGDDEFVAKLTVPVQELLRNPDAAAGKDHSVVRDLRKPDGASKGGRIKFSCKFGPPPAEGLGIVRAAVRLGVGLGFLGVTVLSAVASEMVKIVAPGPAQPAGSGSGKKVGVVKKPAKNNVKGKGKANAKRTHYGNNY